MQAKKMLRGTASLMVAVVLLAGTLAGCGGKSSEVAEKSTAVSTTEDSNLVGNVYKTGLPIVKEKVTLKTLAYVDINLKQPAKDLQMWKVLEEETNVHIEMEEIPAASFAEKTNLLIASGDIPDFFGNGDIVTKHYTSGLFMPLNDLIKQWAPNIQKIIEEPVNYANLRSADGNLYVFPIGEGAPWSYIGSQIFLNKTWMDKLKLDMPKTTDDLLNVLKAFKEKDPNGNGKADEIPLSIEIRDGANGAYSLFGAFGLPITGMLGASHEMIKDGKYIFGPTQEAYRDALTWFNRLYAEGVLDKESFTQKATDIKAKANSSEQIVGMLVGFWPDNYMDATKIDNYVLAPVPKGPKGDQTWMGNAIIPSRGGPAISAKCKNPEVVARWIDNINSSALKKAEVAYGPSSIGIIKIENNKFELMSANTPEGLTFEAWSRNNALRGMVPFYMSAEETEKYRVVDPIAGRKLSYVNEYKPYMWKETITPASFSSVNSDEQQEITTMYADMNPLINNFIAKSIIEGVTDATWSKFQEDLKKAKIDRFIELKQKGLDEYYKVMNKK